MLLVLEMCSSLHSLQIELDRKFITPIETITSNLVKYSGKRGKSVRFVAFEARIRYVCARATCSSEIKQVQQILIKIIKCSKSKVCHVFNVV